MLALLALALCPVLARAETGAGTVYETEVPTIKTETSKNSGGGGTESTSKKHESSNKKHEGSSAAHASNAEEKSSEEPEEEESSSEGHKKQGGAAAGGNGNPPTKSGGEGGSKASKGGSNKSEGSIGEKQKVTPVKNVAHTESSGGSSPVIPILIAVAVLAAISIGVVLYRQRKSGQGPDSRVSSPGAS
jgi:cobalamin biosynthesis Mg chelatase CobN